MRLARTTKGETIKKNIPKLNLRLLHYEALDMRKNQQKRLRRHEGENTVRT